MVYYRRRLARIHAAGYTQYARAAAVLVREEPPGLVIDLGCGAGDLGEGLAQYLGIDASPDMIALARTRYPHARFQIGQATQIPDHRAQVIVAVGEVLNYATDLPGLIRWIHDVRAHLQPGGLLLFDLAGPLRAAPQPRTTITATDDYRLEVTTSTDPARRTLTRIITLTDDEGTETETHVLHLMDPVDVIAALRSAGFDVTALRGYSEDLPFPRGWSGFVARVILEA